MRGGLITATCWLALALESVALQALPSPSQTEQPADNSRDECLQAVFEGDVKSGESFSRSIGGDVVFRLNASAIEESGGWHIVISPKYSDQDWAYPVNPPLRSNNSQAMETGWGLTVREQLKYPHEVRFVLDTADYEKIDKLVIDALWPENAKDPENAANAYLEELKSVLTGMAVVTALDYDKSGPAETVKWMHFRIVLNVPQRFAGDSTLIWQRATCAPSLRSEFESSKH